MTPESIEQIAHRLIRRDRLDRQAARIIRALLRLSQRQKDPQ